MGYGCAAQKTFKLFAIIKDVKGFALAKVCVLMENACVGRGITGRIAVSSELPIDCDLFI
jgi:hypothetical protein